LFLLVFIAPIVCVMHLHIFLLFFSNISTMFLKEREKEKELGTMSDQDDFVERIWNMFLCSMAYNIHSNVLASRGIGAKHVA